jgi:glycosyltransferase involved in cell wall biosynthesis
MPGRPRVLVFCDYFLPGFKGGGPVTTLQNMLVRLGGQIEFHLVTSDRDLGDQRPYPGVQTGSWVPLLGGRVLYLGKGQATIARFTQLICDVAPQTVYLNSSLSRRFSLFPMLAARRAEPRPTVVLAPRGEFSTGALALKPLRKKLYLGGLRAVGLWRGMLWQASSQFEAADIRAIAGADARIAIAPDLPAALPPPALRPPKQVGRARIVFLGRVSPMKNIDGAIAMLAGVTGDVDFLVHGPIEDQPYWERCLRLADDLPASVRLRYEGAVMPDAVPALLGAADALLLPSHGENFGHVVAEALGAGCPVILSDRTPWRGLKGLGIGWDLPLDRPTDFISAIQQIVDMGESDHAVYRSLSRLHAAQVSDNVELVASNLALFRPR